MLTNTIQVMVSLHSLLLRRVLSVQVPPAVPPTPPRPSRTILLPTPDRPKSRDPRHRPITSRTL